MFERYTDEAKRAIFSARTEAVVRKESTISVKDLLLGLAREEKSRTHQICSLKARDAELRSALGIAPLPEHLDRLVLEPKTPIPLDGDAKKTLAYTAQEADFDREFWVDADHLLRGLLRFPNAASDALSKLGLELEAMRAASLQNRKEFPPRRVPVGIKLTATVKKFRPHLLLIAVLLIIFIYLKSQG
jgi:ATP-dependent Clp protease ATP-binding subunit ClpA